MEPFLKLKFENDYSKLFMGGYAFKYIVVAIKLPNGATELITNSGHDNVCYKANYYLSAYDDDFRLKTNKDVRILNYMIVA